MTTTMPLTTIRPEMLTLLPAQLDALMPFLWVFGGTVVALLACVLRIVSPKWPVFVICVLTAIAGIVSTSGIIHAEPVLVFNHMMAVDPFTNFFNFVFLGSALLTIFASMRYLDNEGLQHSEYNVLVLFAALGMMLLASGLDLIVLFIALELMSLAVYVLVGFRRADRRSNEAAMKYFILGSAASAVLLYGAAMLYGATGSTNIKEILSILHNHQGNLGALFTLGSWLVMVGFLFKVASVPFHMWMPDVYEGAPAPVTGFMTTGLKAAAFAAFLRVFVSLGYGSELTAAVQRHIHDILWVSAVLTMVFGNLIALTQTNLKRMLAYSSISHSGYLLVGMVSGFGSEQGYGPVVMYLVAYAIMNIGAFIILAIIAQRGDGGMNLHDMSGFAQKHPWLAFAMSVFLFSMAGVPPTAGFAAKYMLFNAAVQAHETVLVVISVLCSAISVYYYLRVLVYMYMREPVEKAPARRVSVLSACAVASMVVLTIQIGVLPARLVTAAKKAVTSL